jgi:hypothetical protein
MPAINIVNIARGVGIIISVGRFLITSVHSHIYVVTLRRTARSEASTGTVTVTDANPVTRSAGRMHEPFSLDDDEVKWVNLQPYLLSRGYQLRPRYQAGWVGSWKANNGLPLFHEDSLATRVRPTNVSVSQVTQSSVSVSISM